MHHTFFRIIFATFLLFTWFPGVQAQTYPFQPDGTRYPGWQNHSSRQNIQNQQNHPSQQDQPGRQNHRDRTTRIIVMSYNIHFGVDLKNSYDINRIADVIQKSKADIIGLQEVEANFQPISRFDDQTRILAKKLHMYYFFAPIYDFDSFYEPMYYAQPNKANKRRQSGVAILSKFPVEKVENHPLTRLSTIEPNPVPEVLPGFGEAIINIRGTSVPFFVTHLDYRSDKAIRTTQVQEMITVVNKHIGESILVGDLNASPFEPELKPLFKIYRDVLAACKKRCFTFPSDSPVSRIDYILVTPGIQIKSAHVMKETASDHRPVVAVLQIPGDS
jgi:endonuclease/exonuclease/phosphatase family metal-dependent hydrolase